jgi:hypothetical protein
VGSENGFNNTHGSTCLVAGISNNGGSCKRELTEKQIMARRARNRAAYANMTPKQRQDRLERQRMNNKAPLRKEAMKAALQRSREKKKTTLHPESIAMENPLFSAEPTWPTADTSGALGSMPKSNDWVIQELSNATPLYIPPPHEEPDDKGYNESLSSNKTQRSHVPFGQRHALLTRQNMMFEHRICSNTRASNKEGDCMAEDRVGVNTTLPQSVITNNGKY